MLAICQSCDVPLEQGQVFCPKCGLKVDPNAQVKPDASIAIIMLASIGGLLAFFGLFFGLIGAIAEPAFLYVGLVACAIAALLFLLAHFGRRGQLNEWKANERSSVALSRCTYCGLQNDKGTRKCISCGAPLGPR